MSQIQNWINKLSPKGIKFVELGTLGIRNKGTTITAAQMKIIQSKGGTIRIFAGGQTIADVNEGTVPEKDVVRVPSIIVKSRGHIGFTYYDRPFSHKSELWSYSVSSEQVSQKFVYYYLLTQVDYLQRIARAKSVKIPQLSIKDTDKLLIPLPPYKAQQEIVRILDTFTKLEAELEAELEARRKQYKYYRDELLSLPRSHNEGVNWMALGKLLDYEQPGKYRVNSVAYDNSFDTPVLTAGQTFILGYTDEINGVYNASPENPVIIIDDFTTAFKWVDFPFKVKSSAMKLLTLKPEAVGILRYIYYAMKTIRYSPQIHARQWIGAYSNFLIPLPTLAEQDRIITILDKFENLVSDLSFGLPAEIKARRQQYEYYRNKLLTFKEIS